MVHAPHPPPSCLPQDTNSTANPQRKRPLTIHTPPRIALATITPAPPAVTLLVALLILPTLVFPNSPYSSPNVHSTRYRHWIERCRIMQLRVCSRRKRCGRLPDRQRFSDGIEENKREALCVHGDDAGVGGGITVDSGYVQGSSEPAIDCILVTKSLREKEKYKKRECRKRSTNNALDQPT